MTQSPTLRIRLLGGVDLGYGDVSLQPMESARAESLLAYLVLHRDAAVARQRLAFLLWPDSSESQARTNLRHVLHTLRRCLPEADRYLDVTPRTLQWRRDAPYRLDVAVFTEVLARAENATGDGAIRALREAVDGYTGDLLEGRYDEWLLEERERLRHQYLDALRTLAHRLEAGGDHVAAIRYAELLLRQSPLQEETYRLVMRLYHTCGDRARALRTYHQCATALERELGVAPSEPTRAAYDALLPVECDAASADLPPVPVHGPALVGRASELARLTALWRAAEHGRGHFALVTGEPGIGKTRLVEELRTWCAHRGAVTADARSYRAEGALAYAPAVAWLRSDGIRAHLDRLDPAALTELARLLPELLTDMPDVARPDPLTAHDQRTRLFDAVAGALRVAGAPLLLVADDVHWADRETLQILHYLLRAEPELPLLVTATARSEDTDDLHPLQDLVASLERLERCTQLELGRLTRRETAVLAEQLAGAPVGESDAVPLFDATEGNPLFIVEALQAGWRPGRARPLGLTRKVQATITSRLAQLSPTARHLVGIAAIVGREFTSTVLATADGADEATLVRDLDELWRRRIIRAHGAEAYDFSHDKIRESAYLALSPAVRRGHHLRVAQALEQLHAGDLARVAGQLAVHYERADVAEQAVSWYAAAAEAAQRVHADGEAVRLLERALELLPALPDQEARPHRELELLIALPAPLVAVEGYTSGRVMQIQRRAVELARTLHMAPAAPLLRSLAIGSLAGDDFEAAHRFATELRKRGEQEGDNVLVVEAEYVLGVAAFWQAELHTARAHLEEAIARYRPEQRELHLLHYGQDPQAMCLMRLAFILWLLGDGEEAARLRADAIATAAEIEHPYTTTTTWVWDAMLALERRDHDAVRASTTRLTAAIVDEPQPRARHTQAATAALEGFVEALDGAPGAGIARIQQTVEQTSVLGPAAPGLHACLLRVLLEACVVGDDPITGLATVERMLAGVGGGAVWKETAQRLREEFLVRNA